MDKGSEKVTEKAPESLKDEYEAYYGKPLADITREDVGKSDLVDFGKDIGAEKIRW
jgi:hypothetical protein